jgi:hypothetical protein
MRPRKLHNAARSSTHPEKDEAYVVVDGWAQVRRTRTSALNAPCQGRYIRGTYLSCVCIPTFGRGKQTHFSTYALPISPPLAMHDRIHSSARKKVIRMCFIFLLHKNRVLFFFNLMYVRICERVRLYCVSQKKYFNRCK